MPLIKLALVKVLWETELIYAGMSQMMKSDNAFGDNENGSVSNHWNTTQSTAWESNMDQNNCKEECIKSAAVFICFPGGSLCLKNAEKTTFFVEAESHNS